MAADGTIDAVKKRRYGHLYLFLCMPLDLELAAKRYQHGMS